MKVSKSILLAFIFATGVAAASPRLLNEEAAPEEPDPCAPGEDEEPPTCLDTGVVCTMKEDGCCEGLKCTGFGFFKKCEEPPVCLPKWHDCSDGTPCCGEMKCTIGQHEQLECKVPDIETRTVTIGVDGKLVEEKPEPLPPPKNLKTTPKSDEFSIATSSGDPHLKTFDGLAYDCQAEGEVILLKSRITQREIQARFIHMSKNRAIALGKGIVIQDEGDTPRIQVSETSAKETVGNKIGGATYIFLVDGQPKDITTYTGDDRVAITLNKKQLTVKYTATGFQVRVRLGRAMSIVVNLPGNDDVVGLLGTPDKNTANDWTFTDGTVMELPESRAHRMRKPGYDFCTKEFCNRDASKSLFVYPEAGYDFDAYNHCDLPFGDTMEKTLQNVPLWVRELCGSDPACTMDVMHGSAEDARELRNVKLMASEFCRPSGGDCDKQDDCCGDIKCVDFGGFAGKKCDGDMTVSTIPIA